MLFAFLTASAARRHAGPRRAAMSRRPQVESMEGRQLLTSFVTINSPVITEGTGTTVMVPFTITLSPAPAVPVTMDYQTFDKTAVAGSDYTAQNGTLTINPGQTSAQVWIPVMGDSEIEKTENFGLALSNVQNGRFASSTGIATIVDNDTPVAPKLTVNDVQMTRGLDGTKQMIFTVGLNTTVTSPVTVHVATSNISALAGKDYEALSQDLTFLPGETVKQVSVTIYGTSTPTGDKIFFLNLSAPTKGVGLARTIGAGILKYGA